LKNTLSESQVDDVFFKINDEENYENNETYQREFQNWYNQPGLMPHRQFVIHCHFARLIHQYTFQLQNIPGYLTNRSIHRSIQREQQRRLRFEEEPIIDSISAIVKPDLLTVIFTNTNTPYPTQKQIEYPLSFSLEMVEKEISDCCCAICMETKDKKDFLRTGGCNHDFCGLCIGKMISQVVIGSSGMKKDLDCPLCRSKVSCFKYCDENNIYNIIKK